MYENPYTTANYGIRTLEAWLLWTAQYLIEINQSESMFTVSCQLRVTICTGDVNIEEYSMMLLSQGNKNLEYNGGWSAQLCIFFSVRSAEQTLCYN